MPPDPSRKPAEELTRTERKDLTRGSLLRAALALMGQGRSFTSLGIREIAREAGMVPNAFYRHFKTTDELGLALVEEVSLTLRRLLREARQPHVPQSDVVRQSVQVYFRYVVSNRLQFLFICSERAGGSRALRTAIRHDVAAFTSDMAHDIRRLGLFPDLSPESLHLVCGLMVTSMLAVAPEILDLPPDQPALAAQMTDATVQQLHIILMGAAGWKDRPATRAPA